MTKETRRGGGANKSEQERLFLSVVVIGRNEAARLPALFASLPREEWVEWVYVDSDSSDGSAELARRQGARVFRIDPGSVYAPGTGRYAGTLEARGHWILYLDGDMVLRDEFKPFLEGVRAGEGSLPPGTAGFVGRTRNLFLDGEGRVCAERDCVTLARREMGPPENWGRPASYHGGAVLYRRDRVLEAGNWNPAVSQLEEVDLYSRIRARGGVLRAVDLPLADHYTPALGLRERILLNFMPRRGEKNLYGAGQVVAARIREGGLGPFIRCYPYPFVVFAGLVFSPLLFLAWPPLPLVVNGAIAIGLGLAKKWYYYLVYLGNIFQVFRGLRRYRPFTPTYHPLGEDAAAPCPGSPSGENP